MIINQTSAPLIGLALFLIGVVYVVRAVRSARWPSVEARILKGGKLADLIVVDRDVVALAEGGRAHEISETQVLLTLFDGKIVFDQSLIEISTQQ
jgi:hypothetical protein